MGGLPPAPPGAQGCAVLTHPPIPGHPLAVFVMPEKQQEIIEVINRLLALGINLSGAWRGCAPADLGLSVQAAPLPSGPVS